MGNIPLKRALNGSKYLGNIPFDKGLKWLKVLAKIKIKTRLRGETIIIIVLCKLNVESCKMWLTAVNNSRHRHPARICPRVVVVVNVVLARCPRGRDGKAAGLVTALAPVTILEHPYIIQDLRTKGEEGYVHYTYINLADKGVGVHNSKNNEDVVFGG